MRSDAELVKAVRAGEREVFAELVARHERAVFATAWRVVRDNHAAADAAQEAFLQAFQRLGDLRRPEQFGVWLLRIVEREAWRLARRRSRDPRLRLDEEGVSPASFEGVPGRLAADAEELMAALARLPEHERVVVGLRYLEGFAVAEVAAALGRPVGTVTKQLSRAIERLKNTTKGVFQ